MIVFHIDVNNAFLSWTAVELLKTTKYDIRNSYAVIGGDESCRKGIVLAKSNCCKKLGIYTSETLFSAKKKCRVLKVYKPDYELYQRCSRDLFDLLLEFTDDVEIISIDECYLDYTPLQLIYPDYMEFAKMLQNIIFEKLGFTVNIGIANNKLCAKMASDFLKPNKIHTLFEDEIYLKMYPLDVGDLYGVGVKTSVKLKKIGIMTIGDLANMEQDVLDINFKNSINLINLAKGIDYSVVDSKKSEPDSISNEITLKKDVLYKEDLFIFLLELSEKVGLRLRNKNLYCKTICVILKDEHFKRRTKQITLKQATNLSDIIYKTSLNLLDEMWNDEKIRLIGIKLDKLVNTRNIQLSLFDNFEDDTLEKVVDGLKMKYGTEILTKSTLKGIDKD